jgi:hypothetical protein
MNLEELINIARNRLSYLAQQRATAERIGDMAQVASIDADASQTQATLNDLLSLQQSAL